MTLDHKTYIASCAAAAYSAAATVYFIPAVCDRFVALADEFSFIAVLGLVGIAGDFLMAALRAIPAAMMGLMAGTPGMLAGLYAVRRYGENRAVLVAAGAGIGLANAALVLGLRMDTDVAAVLCGFTLAGGLSAFYYLRALRERTHYN